MTLTAQTLARMTASLSFFILFPGFLFYHFSLAIGLIPAFAGGLYGPTSLIVHIIFIILLPLLISDFTKKNESFSKLTIILFFNILFFTIIHYSFNDDPFIYDATKQSFELLISWSSLFFTGRYLSLEYKLQNILISFFIFIILCYFIYFMLSTLQIRFYAKEFFETNPNVATYQGFARSVLIMLLYLIAINDSLIAKIILLISGNYILFFLGARSEFYSFAIISFIIFFLYSLRDTKKFFLFIILQITILICLSMSFDIFYKSRQLEILDLSSSSSWIARQELQSLAIQQISDNPIFGVFGGHITENSRGGYAHNILSAWANYGFIGFFIYLLTIAWAFIGSTYLCYKKNSLYGVQGLSFSVNFISIILCLIAKSVFWPIPAFGWGLYLNAFSISKKNIRY